MIVTFLRPKICIQLQSTKRFSITSHRQTYHGNISPIDYENISSSRGVSSVDDHDTQAPVAAAVFLCFDVMTVAGGGGDF